jgi:hypothetical protein
MQDKTLFPLVLEQSGLSKIFAKSIVTKIALRNGVLVPEMLTLEELQRLLPELEKSMRGFLPPHEIQGATERLRKLAALE